jgi:hypothetical protein
MCAKPALEGHVLRLCRRLKSLPISCVYDSDPWRMHLRTLSGMIWKKAGLGDHNHDWEYHKNRTLHGR